MKPAITPTRQRPARDLIALGITVPYFHPVEWDDRPITYHMKITVLPREVLERLTIVSRKRAAEILPNPNDNRANLDYAPTLREMHAVVRHMLLNRTPNNASQGAGYHNGFDNILHKINTKGGPDMAKRKMDFKRHVCALIATHYPYLAVESAHYLFQAERKSS